MCGGGGVGQAVEAEGLTRWLGHTAVSAGMVIWLYLMCLII